MVCQPGDRRAFLVQVCLAEDRVVRAAIEVDDDPPARFHLDGTGSLDELTVEPLGLRIAKAAQLVRQPAVASLGDDGEDCIQVHVQSHFACQTIQVEEIDAAAQRILNSVASSIVDDQVAGSARGIVGQEQSRLFAAESFYGQPLETIHQ